MSKVDEATIKDFFEYYRDSAIPDPEQYPKRFKFMVDMFLYHRDRAVANVKN